MSGVDGIVWQLFTEFRSQEALIWRKEPMFILRDAVKSSIKPSNHYWEQEREIWLSEDVNHCWNIAIKVTTSSEPAR